MKIDLKKLNASAHASIPFDETIDLTDEKLYGAKPFQSPVHIKGVVSNESGVVRLAGSIETIYSHRMRTLRNRSRSCSQPRLT